MDLFDEIFTNQDQGNHVDEENIDDLYSNIHDVQVAETVAQKLKTLSTEHEKVQKQNVTLKGQISKLMKLNFDLTEKNKNLNSNIKELIETARNEINRKNDQIKNLRAELDNILFKRAARNIDAKELNEIFTKHKLPEEPFAKLPTQLLAKQKEKKTSLLIKPEITSPDGNVGNRQFVRPKRKLESPTSEPAKKIKKEYVEQAEPKKDKLSENSKTGLKTDISLISRYVKDRKAKTKTEVSNSNVSEKVLKPSNQEKHHVSENVLPLPMTNVETGKESSESGGKSKHCSSESSQSQPGKSSRNDIPKSSEKKQFDNSKKTESNQECQEGRKNKSPKEIEASSKESVMNVEKSNGKKLSMLDKESKIVESRVLSNKLEKEPASKSCSHEDLDDVLEIGNSETFDDIDFEPEENKSGETVLFKSMTSNFSIPKASKSEKTTSDKKDNSKKEHTNEISLRSKSIVDKNVRSTDKSKPREGERNRRKSRSPERNRTRKCSGDRDRGRRRHGSGEKDRRRTRSRSRRRRGERSPVRRRSGSRDRARRQDKERRRSPGARRRHESPSERSLRNRVTRSRAPKSPSPTKLKESEEFDINKIEIEDDMSLDALEVIKNKLMGKMDLTDKLEPVNGGEPEEGEVSDSDDEEPKEKPLEKPREKPQEKPKEKPQEKPREKPKEKPKEKVQDKPQEKPKEKIREESKERLREKAKEKPKESPRENLRERREKRKSHEKPKDVTQEKPQEKPQEKTEEKTEKKKTEEKSQKTQETPKEKTEEKPDEKPKENPKEKTPDQAMEPSMDRVVKIEELRKCLMNVGGNQDTVEGKVPSPVKKIPDVSTKIKEVLQDYSSDEIEKKLIPLKKRQFNELQMEEQQLRVKIASRSKSNTPRRDSECSDVMMKSSPPLVIASPIYEQDELNLTWHGDEDTEEEDNDVFDDKRVSPLKLSLRGIGVRGSSSSGSGSSNSGSGSSNSGSGSSNSGSGSSNSGPGSSNSDSAKIPEIVTNPDSEHRLQDDNAMFPSKVDTQMPPVTPVKRGAVLDITNDLILTDDSDIEISPVKLKGRAAAAARKKEQLNFTVLKQLPLTPKDNQAQKKVDETSPEGISTLLKSPMVSGPLLVTSTPVIPKPRTLENQPPEKADENSSNSADLAMNVRRKRFARSGVKLN